MTDNLAQILKLAEQVVTAWDWQTIVERPEPERIDVTLTNPDDLKAIATGLRVKRLGNITAITGHNLDHGSEQIELCYHFCAGPVTITLRAILPQLGAAVESISAVIPSAEAHERQLQEKFGVQVKGLRSNNFPHSGQTGDGKETARIAFEFTSPYHAVIKNLGLAGRISAAGSHAHAIAYCLGVEKMSHIEAPPRAQAIRLLIAELERIHYHLLWLDLAARRAGLPAPLIASGRECEIPALLLQQLTGSSDISSVNLPGGVRCDLTPGLIESIKDGLDNIRKLAGQALETIAGDLVGSRTQSVALLTLRQAEVLGACGPTARASGVSRDVRLEAPYAAYQKFLVRPVIDKRGDLAARLTVRVKEILESSRLIQMVIEDLPGGRLTQQGESPSLDYLPAGETIIRVEAPEGELFYFIKKLANEPLYITVQPPITTNRLVMLKLSAGHPASDFPLITAGIEPGFSLNKRF